MAKTWIPDIKITRPDGCICDLRADMARLNWEWDNIRIQSYLTKVATRYQCPLFTAENIPFRVLSRLTHLVNLYAQIQQTMKVLGINWNDAQILDMFAKYGTSAQMPLQGWEELLTALDKRWFESDGAF